MLRPRLLSIGLVPRPSKGARKTARKMLRAESPPPEHTHARTHYMYSSIAQARTCCTAVSCLWGDARTTRGSAPAWSAGTCT